MVFQLLNQKLIEEFYSDNEIKLFKNLRILAVDGSTVRLPPNPEIYQHYGKDAGNANSVPLARISILFDVLNNLTLDASLNSYSTAERDSAIGHIKHINHSAFKDLLIFDRGYPSSFLIFYLIKNNKHFLMRIKENFLFETNDAITSDLHDSIITITPSNKKNRKTTFDYKEYLPDLNMNEKLKVRLLIFDLKSGKKEIIITSLIDQNEFTYNNIFELYGKRWNIEEGYKFYKCITEIENFNGKSKIAIEQEFYATIFTCNISALLMQEAQNELELVANEKKELKYDYKVNRNILIGTIKNEIIEVFLSNRDLTEYCQLLKERIKQNLIPMRPNRQYPRIFKRGRSNIHRRAL